MTSTGVALDSRRIAWRIVDAVRPLGLERGIDLAESLLYLLAKAVGDDGLDLGDMSRNDPRQVLNVLATLDHEDDLVDATTFRDVDDSTVVRVLRIISEALDRGDWADRRPGLVAVLDAVYAASASRSSALSEAHGTPEAMADLLVRAVDVGGSAFDPLCGLGSTLLSAARHGATSVAGIDINPSAVRRTRIRLRMHGLDDAEVAVGNIFEVLPAHRKRYSTVVMHPPWGLRLAEDSRSMLEALDLRAEHFRGPAREIAWLHLALELLAPGGRAAVLLPATSTEQLAVYGDLIQRGLVEAVVSVPQGSTSPISVRSVIWIIRAEASNDRAALVLDAARIDLQDSGQPAAADKVLQAAGDRIRDWRRAGFKDVGPSHVARKVSQGDASSLGLWPARHLDTAPSTQPRAPEPPVHLLSRIRVEGYKSIGRLQEVPLAPITLVFGANSAGKSSLMQALLLLKQSIGEDTLVTQGDSADVGSFGGIAHRHEARTVRFGLTFGAPPGLASTPEDRRPRRGAAC